MTWAVAFLAALAVFAEDRGSERLEAHRTAIAEAVAAESQRAPVPPRRWAALLLTVGWHESALSIRISDGHCKPHECDRGRAKGMFQLWANTLNRDSWAKQDGDVALQVRLASEQLRRAHATCPNDFPIGALNAYAGRRCTAEWAGLNQRVATYRRLRP